MPPVGKAHFLGRKITGVFINSGHKTAAEDCGGFGEGRLLLRRGGVRLRNYDDDDRGGG